MSIPAPVLQVNQGGTINELFGRTGHLREESGPFVITLLGYSTPMFPLLWAQVSHLPPALEQGPGPECHRGTSRLQAGMRHVLY